MAEASQRFFATVQNKMHWAAHGHTAAELISLRANAKAPNAGLTTWAGAAKGGPIRKADVSIAKNYLNKEELGTLTRYRSFIPTRNEFWRACWNEMLDDGVGRWLGN